MKKYFFLITVISGLLVSCSENIDTSFASGPGKIVIEGNIENNKFPEVSITRNSPLDKKSDPDNMLVLDAKVYVSDGIITDTLRLDTVLTATIPIIYLGKKITGTPGKSYTLTVEAEGKKYTAITSIPMPIKLDSVYWKAYKTDKPDLGFAYAFLSEPAGVGNAYRWYSKLPTRLISVSGSPVIINRRYLAQIGSSFDDKFIDGKKFEFFYPKAYDETEETILKDEIQKDKDKDSYGYYKKTDTIYIKFCSIDKDAYSFYNTYETATASNGNPFASPTTILTNIKGGALGVWAGCAATYDTILPK